MRRLVLFVLGLVELGVAVALVQLSREVPSRAELEGTFQQAQEITGEARDQVQEVREQVKQLQRPELQQLAANLQKQARKVSKTLRDRKFNFEILTSVDNALEGVVAGLDGTAALLDSKKIEKLGDGLGAAADFLDQKFVPAAETAAQDLDKATALLADNARQVSQYFKELPQDFKTLRDVHDGLAQFGAGLDGASLVLEPKRVQTMREGLQGMQQALTAGADQVTKLADLPYPDLANLWAKKPKKLLPDGGKIAEGLTKAAKGVQAVDEQLAELAKQLPKLRESLLASKKVVAASRDQLGLALKKQPQVEPILKDLPRQAAQLAEKLPQLGQGLAKVLRETKRFQVVAAALRQTQGSLKEATRHWPALRETVQSSAEVLQAARQQLAPVVQHRAEYEQALDKTATLAEDFAAALPKLSENLLGHLSNQEQSLDRMGQTLGKVSGTLPKYGSAAGQIADTSRWLIWLMAAVVALHGLAVLLGLRTRGPQPAA